MKKLLISNIVTAVIVLGIIAAYSFSKPEQKAGVMYATVTVDYFFPDYTIMVTYDDKSEIITSSKKYSGSTRGTDWQSDVDKGVHAELGKLDSQGYELVSTDALQQGPNSIANSQGRRFFTLRKR